MNGELSLAAACTMWLWACAPPAPPPFVRMNTHTHKVLSLQQFDNEEVRKKVNLKVYYVTFLNYYYIIILIVTDNIQTKINT